MSQNTVLVVMMGVTMALTGYVAATAPGSAPGGVEELRQDLAKAETQRQKDVEKLAGEVRDLNRRVTQRLDAVETRIETSAVPGIPLGDAAAMGGAAGDVGAIEERIAAKVAETMDARMDRLASRTANRSLGGEWKASIEELHDELGMTDAQRDAVRQVFDAAHDEMYVLFKTERLDGGSLLDDLVVELKQGVDPETAFKGMIKRLFVDRVPGTDRTYVADLIDLKEDVSRALSDQLRPEQVRKIESLNVDLLGVKTGHDPVGQYVQAKLQ